MPSVLQLSKPAWAARYEAAQKGDGSGVSLEAALRNMGTGDDASLEVRHLQICRNM